MKIEKSTGFLLLGSLSILGWALFYYFVLERPLSQSQLGLSGVTNSEFEIVAISDNYNVTKIFFSLMLIGFTAMVLGWRSVATSLGGGGARTELARFLLLPGLVLGIASGALTLGAASSSSFMPLHNAANALDVIGSMFIFIALCIIGIDIFLETQYQTTENKSLIQVVSGILVVGSVIGVVMYAVSPDSAILNVAYLALLVSSLGIYSKTS